MDTPQPLVTVVIPAFNAERHIEQAMRSVLAQTHAHLELLVVDDCSTDDTCSRVQAVTREDPRAALHMLERNSGGPARPRNVGVSRAHGKFIAFIDADDVWHPRKLEIQLAVLRDTGAGFVSTEKCDTPFESHGECTEDVTEI